MSIATYLTALDRDRDALAANLTTKGVPASSSETFTTLVPKVLDIPSGGGGGIKWETGAANCTVPSGATQTNSKTLGVGIKTLTVENRTFGAGSSSNAQYWAIGFPDIEEITFKNCTFGNNTDYGMIITTGQWAGLKKVVLDGCNVTYSSSYEYSYRIGFKGTLTTNLYEVELKNFTFDSGGVATGGMFNGRSISKVTFSGTTNLNNVTDFASFFNACSSLTSIDLTPLGDITATRVYRMFYDCSSLQSIDISNFDCTSITSSSNYKDMFNNVPTTCTIYVKDAANQAWFSSHFGTYTFTIKS